MRARNWGVALGACLGMLGTPLLGDEPSSPPEIDGTNTFVPFKPGADAAAGTRILGALESEIVLDFHEAPLDQVVSFLADQAELTGRVVIDQRGLDESGIGLDTPVTLRLSGVRVRAALDLVLGPLDLDWAIHKEVLFITTQQRSAELLSVVTYPVADLLSRPRRDASQSCSGATACAAPGGGGNVAVASGSGGGGGFGGGGGDGNAMAHASASASGAPAAPCPCACHRKGAGGADELMNALTSTVVPQTWDEVGGAGSLSMVNGEVLVVSQTRRGHEEIADFLAKLRHSLASIPGAVSPVVASADVVPTISRVHARDQERPVLLVPSPGPQVFGIEPPGAPAVEVPRPLVIEAPRLSEPLAVEPSPVPTRAPAPQPTVVPTPE